MRTALAVLSGGIAVAALSHTLAAQGAPIQRGSIQVAGTAQLTHFRTIGESGGTTHFELAPRVGYFVARGLAINASVRYQRISADDARITGWAVGPGLSYYLSTHSQSLFPFLSARTLISRDRVTIPGSSVVSKGSRFSWLVSGGMLVMLGQHVGISGELYYQRERFTQRAGVLPETVLRYEFYGVQWGVAAFLF